MTWRNELLRLLQTGRYRKQGDLVAALAARGLVVNQSSVSRELGLHRVQKVGGVYQLPTVSSAPAPIHGVTFTAGGCMGVIRTDPAFASVIGQFIDESEVDGVLGTVSGDDTVFVALKDASDHGGLLNLLGWG